MKKIIYHILNMVLVMSGLAYQGWAQVGPVSSAPSHDKNHIVTYTPQVPGIQSMSQFSSKTVDELGATIQYFDGLGRPLQTVSVQGSPGKKDVVQPIVYDVYGREQIKYLPYAAQDGSGVIRIDPVGTPGNYDNSPHYLFYHNSNKVEMDNMPYAQTVFEESSLNRILKQGAPGEAWQPDGTRNYGSTDGVVKKAYGPNGANEVLKWTYTASSITDSPGIVNASSGTTAIYYGPTELYKTKTKDENQNEVIEYTDKEGRTVLKRVQAAEGTPVLNDANYASTYYIYDVFGRLVCVLPPEAVKLITQSSAYFGKTDLEKLTFLNRWAFRYEYDHRGRMTLKQVPGAEYIYMLYDDRDRLVMTQDGNQRALASKEWTFTKYDALNRPVLTGVYVNSASPSVLQNDINSFYATIDNGEAWFESYIGSGTNNVIGYDNKSFPQISNESKYLTVTYYDIYDDFIAPPATQSNEGYWPVNQNLPGEVTGNRNKIAAQVTATKVKNLSTGTWLRTVNYYDTKYRLIQTVADHQKGTVRTSNVFDFTGRLIYTQRKYVVEGTATTIKESFTYDHSGRQVKALHSINGATPIEMVTNEYNELGQLVTKKLHKTGQSGQYVTADPAIGQPGVVYGSNIDLTTYNSAQHTQIATNRIRLLPSSFHVPNGSIFKGRIGFSQQDADAHNSMVQEQFLQVIDYRYNIRGWLKKINDPIAPANSDLFNMELQYNMPSIQGISAQYNGNISEAVWKSVGLDQQSYGYSYDNMNRLTEAKYFNASRPQTHNGMYDEKIGLDATRPSYDLNGNILNLVRKGKTAEGISGVIDDLHYDYTNSGNRLVHVSDARPDNSLEEGFKEVAGGDEALVDYTYDANGNMIKDENKGIGSIEYNYLNLPSKVSKTASDYIVYTYDATGRKLMQQVFGTEAKVTDYIGELVYENSALQFINHNEGRTIPDNTPGDPWEYQYFMKDHLGNTRVVLSEKSSSIEYKATMENNTQGNEMATFRNYSSGVRSSLPLFDHTDEGTTYNYSQLLNGGSNSQVGLAKSFAVNSGDVFDLEVYAKYEALGSSPSNTVNSLLSALINAFSLGAGTTPLDGSQAQSAFNTRFPTGGPWIGSDDGWNENAPKAYLNYLLFNENFQLVSYGFDQITAGKQEGVSPDIDHDYLSLHVQVQQKGYLYIYVSNEDAVPTNVYFDDMKIVRYTAVEQVNDYYPFGLTFNSYQRENSPVQNHLYNGKEEQDELGIGWLDYGARMYMPEIGRWGSIDPLADQYFPASPYNYALNNPGNIVDPDGRSVEIIIDLENMTITVNMTIAFYGTGATEENVNAAINTINKMWNANAGDDGFSDAGDGWKMKVSATGIITDEEKVQEMAKDNEGNALFNYVRIEEQNDQTYFEDANGVKDKKVSHYNGGNSGFWITNDMKSTTPAHEIGHGLFLDHGDGGIMIPGTENRSVNSDNLSRLREMIFEHGTDKSSLVDKYLFDIKRLNLGRQNTELYDKQGYPLQKQK